MDGGCVTVIPPAAAVWGMLIVDVAFPDAEPEPDRALEPLACAEPDCCCWFCEAEADWDMLVGMGY